MVLPIFAIALALLGGWNLGPWVQVAIVPLTLVGAAYWTRRETRGRRDLPAPVDQFATSITFSRNGLLYGTDVGLVSFADGWLHFEGAACAFSLPSPGEVTKRTPNRFLFAGPGGTHEVDLTPQERAADYRAELARWQGGPLPATEDAPLPPVVPDGRAPVRAAMPALGGLAMLMAGMFVSRNEPFLSLGIWFVLIAGVLFCLALRFRDEERLLRSGLPPRSLKALP